MVAAAFWRGRQGGSRPPRATVRRKETREVGRVGCCLGWGGRWAERPASPSFLFSFYYYSFFFVEREKERKEGKKIMVKNHELNFYELNNSNAQVHAI